MIDTKRALASCGLFLGLLLVACGGQQTPGGEAAERQGEDSDLRALHAKVLERGPTVDDLQGASRGAAAACMLDADSEACRRGRENLSRNEWSQVQEVMAEHQRQLKEAEERVAACKRGDVDALRSMYPGRFAFYQQVSSPPPFEERPLDAVVVIGISGNLISKGKKILEREMASEALKVQVQSPGSSTGFYPKPGSPLTNERFFYGHYTPSIERQMSAPRPDCDRYKNSAFVQGACRRDLTVSIVRDWLESRGHRSVRFVLSGQSSWPEFKLLFERRLSDFETSIDTNFDSPLSRSSTFIGEICGIRANQELWTDYEFYVRTLFED